MKNIKNKTRGEILIGEVALTLLNEKKTPVSWKGILNRLEAWLEDEPDKVRAEVLKLVIADVRSEMQRLNSDRRENNAHPGRASPEDHDRLSLH